MEHVAAIMLLIACSDDLSLCQEATAPTIAYETMQDCERDIEPAMRDIAVEAPTVLAQCFQIDPALFAEDVEISWDITEGGVLDAELALINPSIPDTYYADASAYSAIMTDAVVTYVDGDTKSDRLGDFSDPDPARFGW